MKAIRNILSLKKQFSNSTQNSKSCLYPRINSIIYPLTKYLKFHINIIKNGKIVFEFSY